MSSIFKSSAVDVRVLLLHEVFTGAGALRWRAGWAWCSWRCDSCQST